MTTHWSVDLDDAGAKAMVDIVLDLINYREVSSICVMSHRLQ